jgi:hypothetical protein
MPRYRVFVSQAWPGLADRAWAERFVASLRSHGWDVVEEWSAQDEASLQAAEQGLRQSNLIVSLVEPEGPESPNFYFEYGVATFGDKEFIAVAPKEIAPERFPASLRDGGYLVKETPAKTAAALVARIGTRRSA